MNHEKPKTTDPVAWAQYNQRVSGLTAAEYEEELCGAAPVPAVCAPLPICLTPTEELQWQVADIADRLDAMHGARASLYASRLRVALATFEARSEC